MSEISTEMQSRIDELEPALRQEILSRNVPIQNLNDLIVILEDLVK